MRVDPLSWNSTYGDTELGVFLAPCVAMTIAEKAAHLRAHSFITARYDEQRRTGAGQGVSGSSSI